MWNGRAIGALGLSGPILIVAACGNATNGTKCGSGTKLVGDTCMSASGRGGEKNASGGADAGGGAGTGGSGPSAGEGGVGGTRVSVCADASPVSTTNLMVSDFEDGFATGWGNYNDGAGTQLGTGNTPDAALIPGGRGTSKYAAHSWGTGFTVWGAGIQRWYGPPCRDVSVVDGFAFWARGDIVMRVAALTPETQGVANGGDCTAACFDAYGATIRLSDQWQLYAYRWDDLRQTGSGTAVPFSHRVLGLAFALATPNPSDTTPFDYWIDDVTYFIGAPPTGGGGAGGSGGSP